MKQSIRIGTLLLASTLGFSACRSDESSQTSQQNVESSQSGYVDIDNEKENIKIESKSTVLDVRFDGYTAHEKSYSMYEGYYTLDENYLYLWDGERTMDDTCNANCIKFNLKTGRIENLCEKAGCPHDINLSRDCSNLVRRYDELVTKNGLYEVEDGILWLVTGDFSGDERTKVWENTFSTDYAKEIDPDFGYGFRYMIRANTAHLFGQNWYYSVDLQTMEQTEPIVVSDTQIIALDICGDYLWYATQDLELFCWQLSSGEKKKIADKIWRVTCTEDKVYYQADGCSNGTLTCCNPDGSEPQVLLEGISNSFYVTEKSIYYLNGQYNSKQGAFRCDLDGQNIQEIKLELDYTELRSYQTDGLSSGCFVSDPTCNYIFLVDRSNTESALFAIPKDTTEAVGFSLYS